MDTMKKMTRRTFGGGFDVAMCCDLCIAGERFLPWAYGMAGQPASQSHRGRHPAGRFPLFQPLALMKSRVYVADGIFSFKRWPDPNNHAGPFTKYRRWR